MRRALRWFGLVAGLALLAALPSYQEAPRSEAPAARQPAGEAKAPAPAALRPARAPAVSPTGEWVALGLEGLTLVDRTGRPHQVWTGQEPAFQLSWAPSGDWLLARMASGRMLLLHPASFRVTDLTDRLPGLSGSWVLIGWAPDGARVLVTQDHAPEAAPIWEITPASGSVRKAGMAARVVGLHLLADGQAVVLMNAGCCGAQMARLDLETGALTDAGFRGYLTFSPDGRRFAEAPYRGGQLSIEEVGGGRPLVSGRDIHFAEPRPGVEITGEYLLRPLSWSPDGQYLALSLMTGPDRFMLRVLDLSEQVERPELVVPDWTGDVRWLGPGHDLLYSARHKDGLAVYLNGSLVAIHEGGQRLGLTKALAAARSGDGRRLAYTVELEGRKTQLVVADLTTGRVEKLPDSDGLAPLTWNWNADSLVVGRMVYSRQDLGGGAYTEGWDLAEILVRPVGQGPGPGAFTEPLWGPPGTEVWGKREGEEVLLSRTWAPVTIAGRRLTPVQVGTETFFLRQDAGTVWLDGRVTRAGTLEIWEQPRRLWNLPLTLGAIFDLQQERPNAGARPHPYHVEGFETVSTPAGGFPSVIVGDREREGHRLWWSPGLGVVQAGDVPAARIVRGEPSTLPLAAQLDARTTGYLVGGLQVLDQDGGVLFHQEIDLLRSKAAWADGGAPAPVLLYETYSQARPNRIWRAFVYRPDRRTFEPARWRLPDGRVRDRVAGDLEAGQGFLRLTDDERYPLGSRCLFRWNGSELACSGYEDGAPPETAEQFLYQLAGALDEESWARIFVDPAAGRAAYRATREGESRNRLSFVTPRKRPDGAWVFDLTSTRVELTLVQTRGGWKVESWRMK